jgi:aldehyde dehydrogenase (NAD+)
LALRAIAFAAMGTAGQRCTTLRRLIVHETVYDRVVPRLARISTSASIGSPLDGNALVGPLIDEAAFRAMEHALAAARAAGGTVHGGGRHHVAGHDDAFYARSARWRRRPSRRSFT